jgi:hypothetical protein
MPIDIPVRRVGWWNKIDVDAHKNSNVNQEGDGEKSNSKSM